MPKKSLAVSGFALLLTCALARPVWSLESQCQDLIDNDGDTFIDGADSDCTCLDANTTFTGGCTANDVHFVVIGLGTLSDGCVNATDFMDIQLGAQLTTTANTRYDVGMWIGLDPNVQSARTGSICERDILTPVSAVAPNACSLTGPYRDGDTGGDVCGELDTADTCGVVAGNTINAVYLFPETTHLPCSQISNGFATLPTCTSWDQQASDGSNQKPSCTNFTGAIPGTSSKCRCEIATLTNVPRPNLDLACSCKARTTPGEEDIVDCGVEYTNPGTGTCSQASGGAETFDLAGQATSCGTAAYLRFLTTYPDGFGDVLANSTSPATCQPTAVLVDQTGDPTLDCTPSGRGTVSDDTTGTLTWTPRSDAGLTSGVIGVNETERMRFSFQRNSSISSSNLTFSTTAYWSTSSSFSSPIAQEQLVCSMEVSATPVTLASFEAKADDDGVVLSWTTATEAGNAGFNLYADTASGKRKLNRRLIASHTVDSVEPQRYRVRVPAEGLEGARFFVEDVSVDGRIRRHGPFESERGGRRVITESIDWAGIREELRGAEARRRQGGLRSLTGEAARPGKKPAVDLSVSAAGLQRVTYEELAAAGFDFAGVKLSDLALSSRGAAVPLRAAGSDKFGPGAYIEFYGEALDTLYSGTNVYRLTVERGGARAAVDASAPDPALPAAGHYLETTRVERDRAYAFGSPIGDPWYDTVFQGFAPGGTSVDFSLTVDHLVPGAAPARLDVALWGMTDWPSAPDHHVLVQWNGTQVADERFDGGESHPISLPLGDGAVQEGANTLRVSVPADLGVDYDFLALDQYAVTYPRALVARGDRLSFSSDGSRFTVSGLSSPDVAVYRSAGANDLAFLSGVQVRPAGGGFAVSFPGNGSLASYHVATVSALGHPGISAARDGAAVLSRGVADYLILSHPTFVDALSPLVAARQSQGRSVRVADLHDVYAAFSGGIVDAQAIRDYVAYAHRNLGTREVLLVGGDTYDYRDFLGLGAVSFVPSPYVATSPWVRFTPADPVYADVDRDGVPDLGIGRLPVRSLAELEIAVSNILSYEGKAYRDTAVFAADAFEPEAAVNFSVISDKMAAGLPGHWPVTKAYIDNDGVQGAKGILVAAINSGVALTNFVGHSGPTVWSFQGLFNSSDALGLTNAGAPTVVSQWGCWNNYHVSPQFESLAQKLLLSGDRGAAAVLGATGLTEVKSDRALGALLSSRLSTPGMTLGQAVLAAKRDLARRNPEMVDVLLGWTILGDPGMAVTP